MFFWIPRFRRQVLAEADEMMEYYGDGAYHAARKRMREARAQGKRREEKLYSRVALEVAKRIDFPVGEDTATRYLTRPSIRSLSVFARGT